MLVSRGYRVCKHKGKAGCCIEIVKTDLGAAATDQKMAATAEQSFVACKRPEKGFNG
ncbi:hypothetical protein FLA_1729 [Filimonas lacunae]|nr:hypothetical protein FLA_1729 [Filimonas lacunae]